MGVRVGVANFFLNQSIGVDETITFQLEFFSIMNIVGATDLGGLEWAWHPSCWQAFFGSIDRY